MVRFTLLVFAVGFVCGLVTPFVGGETIGTTLMQSGARFQQAAHAVEMHDGLPPLTEAAYVEGTDVLDGRGRLHGRR